MMNLKEDDIQTFDWFDLTPPKLYINKELNTKEEAEQLKKEILEALEFREKLEQYLDKDFLNEYGIDTLVCSKTQFKELKEKADLYDEWSNHTNTLEIANNYKQKNQQLEAQVKELKEELDGNKSAYDWSCREMDRLKTIIESRESELQKYKDEMKQLSEQHTLGLIQFKKYKQFAESVKEYQTKLESLKPFTKEYKNLDHVIIDLKQLIEGLK